MKISESTYQKISEHSQNLSYFTKLLEAKLQIESLKQQIFEKDSLNAKLKAAQLQMANANQAEINDLKNQLSEATKEINLLKSIKIELSVQIDTLKQKLIDLTDSNKNLFDNSDTKSASFSGTLPSSSFFNSDEYDEEPKLSSQIFSLSNEIEKLKKESQPILELDDAKKEILSLRNQISEIKNLSQTGNFRNKIRNESRSTEESIISYEEQNKLLQNELYEKKKQISNLLAQIQDLQSTKAKNEIDKTIIKERTINDLKHKISEYENEINLLHSKLSDKETVISTIKKEHDIINDNKISDENRVSKLEKQLIEKDKVILELQEQINSIQSNSSNREQKFQNDIAQLTSQIAEKDSQIKKKDKEIRSLKNFIEDMKSSFAERSLQTEKMDQESDSQKNCNMDSQIEKLVKEIAKLRRSKAKLQQQIDQLTQSDSLKDSQINMLRGQITIFQQFKVTEEKKDAELILLRSQIEDIQSNEEEREAQIQLKLDEKDTEIKALKEQIERLKKEQVGNNLNTQQIEKDNILPNQNNDNVISKVKDNEDNNENENNIENKISNENNLKKDNSQNLNKKDSNINETKENNPENNINENKNTSDNKKLDKKANEKNNKKVIIKDDIIDQKFLSEKEKIIDSYESQIASYQTKITELENKIFDYDNGKRQTYDTQLKMLEIDKLNNELFLKDSEIDSLKSIINRQQKQIEDSEKIQYLHTNNNNNSNSSLYDALSDTTNNDNDLQLFQKNQEIAQLKLQISDQQDKINELKLEIKSNNLNSYYEFTDYNNQNRTKNSDYLSLKHKCEKLEKELNQKKIDEQVEAQNTLRLKNELSSYQIKYNQMKDETQSDSLLYQTLKEEYTILESKHQVALKLIGKLWSRNQTLIRENGGKSSLCSNDTDDFSPDDFQFL